MTISKECRRGWVVCNTLTNSFCNVLLKTCICGTSSGRGRGTTFWKTCFCNTWALEKWLDSQCQCTLRLPIHISWAEPTEKDSSQCNIPLCVCICNFVYCHTRLHLGFSADNLASSSLQDGATKWYYFLNRGTKGATPHIKIWSHVLKRVGTPRLRIQDGA